ncbi:hypothetical protein L3i22_065440 [Actinoplanes sp. L3-i22]|nr:hypothetical protein L3i22_065430 [Actinoplanes sp. L3-i22]BCY11456.1 hypothetical protein L3i22_065440 [Actinoplanes sp. L3-i22]
MSAIERRLLINYRTDPEITARLLPAPLRPQVVNGWAVSGICLVRLAGARPSFVPAAVAGLGFRSENAAHRIAVEWDTPDGIALGVYIPRRDTASRLNSWVGGRLFPGRHHHSRFDVRENRDELRISVDGPGVDVHVRTATDLPASQLFRNVDHALEFFRRGAAGFSTTPDPTRLDGLELVTEDWNGTPAELLSVRSTFFEDPARFPPGSAIPDCALLMRDLAATWNPLPPMTVRPTTGQLTRTNR